MIERRLAEDAERDFRVRGRLERARVQLAEAPPPVAPASVRPAAGVVEPAGDAPFGELLQGLPRNATDVDRRLLARLHLQRCAAERAFIIAEAGRRPCRRPGAGAQPCRRRATSRAA